MVQETGEALRVSCGGSPTTVGRWRASLQARSHGNASERGAEVTVDVAGKGPQARAGARRCVVDVGGGCTPSRSWSSFKMQMN